MKNEQTLILISNDDGITAKGINELIRMLRPLGSMVVMAPDSPRSGAACSLTVVNPVALHPVRPRRRPDDVLLFGHACRLREAGPAQRAHAQAPTSRWEAINHGDNSAVNVHYSGTMGVVLEGCMRASPPSASRSATTTLMPTSHR